MKKPNILWICSDQQRWDTLGCYGNKWVNTPNLDRVASSGTCFTQAYSQSPVCTPSRASFLTGRYACTTRCRQNGQDIPDTETLCEWEMNVEDKTVTLINPTNTRLGRMTLPMSPMVGCFGVAPSLEQAISTATSSNHGGNMDYRGFVEGVTVYFPVFASGALFHIGDGHALQGDGEIVGTGIEISFDVQFTVRVLKGKKSFWPRGENEAYIFTAGNARPLDQCIQHATTEMLRWLQSDYDLDPRSAHTLLGQCVEYDMGNVYDPAYTMVCKIKKILLENIGINTHSVHNDFSRI